MRYEYNRLHLVLRATAMAESMKSGQKVNSAYCAIIENFPRCRVHRVYTWDAIKMQILTIDPIKRLAISVSEFALRGISTLFFVRPM